MCQVLATMLYVVTNYMDKFLVTKSKSATNIKTLLVFSTLVSGLLFLPISLFIANFEIHANPIAIISVLCAAIVYILATWFYLLALGKADTTIVVSVFQLIPVFAYLLGAIFFQEFFTIWQLIGAGIIIASAIIISLQPSKKQKGGRFKVLILAGLSALGYALYYFLFDIALRNDTYGSCVFWNQAANLCIGIVLILIKSYRKSFIRTIKKNGKLYIGFNFLNEVINSGAGALSNLANVTLPLAMVNIISGFQGAFSFIIGAILTFFFPKIIKEDLRKKVVCRKLLCILVSIIGIVLVFFEF